MYLVKFVSIFRIFLLGGLLSFCSIGLNGQPTNFTDKLFLDGWNGAVGLTFDENEVMYVWERSGRIFVVENGVKRSTPLLDIRHEVGGWRDYGMLGVALDPDFLSNGRIYLLYVVDRHHLLNFQDINGDGIDDDGDYDPTTNEYFNATTGRITRYVVNNPANPAVSVVDESTRTILLGDQIGNGFPILHQSHGTGAILFGDDGSLLAACGDGASYSAVDNGGSDGGSYAPQGVTDGIIPSAQDVGAFRSQMLSSLNGKIVRINPDNGEAYPSNPFYDGNPNSNRSKVYTLGLRNPYRMYLRQGTGSHNISDGTPGVIYLGDVGWGTREDLHVITAPGQNCGWPIYEGMTRHNGYFNAAPENQDAPTPNGCSQAYYKFTDLLKQDENNTGGQVTFPDPCGGGNIDPNNYDLFVHHKPAFDWGRGSATARTSLDYNVHHNLGAGNPIPGNSFTGNASTGGTWINFPSWPEEWRNYYVHGDYGGQWIRFFGFDGNDVATEVKDFDPNNGNRVVFIAADHANERLFYIKWGTQIREFKFGDGFPTAVASSNLNYGASPLAIQFDGSQSSDPTNQNLTYLWDFGDSNTSTDMNPMHTYTVASGLPTQFNVTLTVTDTDNNQDQTNFIISVNNTPPVIQSTSIDNVDFYTLAGSTILNLSVTVSDSEHGPTALNYAWQTTLYHDNHRHDEPVDESVATTTQIDPLGCGGDLYYYGITLTVTDDGGLSDTFEKLIYPNCNAPQAINDLAIYQDGGTVIIDVLANDLSNNSIDPATVVIKTDVMHGTTIVNPTTGVVTYTHDGMGSSNDEFTYTVEDDMGNESNIATVSLSLSGPPTVLITSPSEGAELVGSSVEVTFSASGDLTLADHVHLSIDGRPHITMSGVNGSYTFTDLHPGYHTIKAQLVDENHTPLDNMEAMHEVEIRLLNQSACQGNGLLALYTFEEGSGTTINDVSGVGPPLNLTISDPGQVNWLNGGGLQINGNTMINSMVAASKIIDGLQSTNAFSIEVWAEPENTTQSGPARLLTISANVANRNVLLGQSGSKYTGRLRTTNGGSNNGLPNMETGNNIVQTSLQHIVYTRDASGNVRIYVNGDSELSTTRGGNFSNWNDNYQLILVNELSKDRLWKGKIYKVAVYDQALSSGKIDDLYNNGVPCSPADCNLVFNGLTATQPTFCNMNDGSIQIDATGTNLLYSIDNGISFQASNTFSNLHPGDYVAVVKESNDENCAYSNGATLNGFSISTNSLTVSARAYLQGAHSGTEMQTTLRDDGHLPLSQPYNVAPWNYSGTECVNSIPVDAVDWVLVQLRKSDDHSLIMAQRACFVRKDGMLMDLDGSTSINFGHLHHQSAYISIHHRNHSGVMTLGPVGLD